MSWADLESGACPATHPVSVPRLHLKSIYDTFGGPGITLSSGAPGTMHADFWNTWDQAKLAALIKSCINESGSESVCAGNPDRRLENPNFPAATPPGTAPFSFPPPADTAKPVVTMNELRLNTKTFSATAALSAAASDNVRVARVEYLIDGEEQYIDTTNPYSFGWDTRTDRWIRVKSLDTTTSILDLAAVAGTTVQYAIEAVDNAGNKGVKRIVYASTPSE